MLRPARSTRYAATTRCDRADTRRRRAAGNRAASPARGLRGTGGVAATQRHETVAQPAGSATGRRCTGCPLRSVSGRLGAYAGSRQWTGRGRRRLVAPMAGPGRFRRLCGSTAATAERRFVRRFVGAASTARRRRRWSRRSVLGAPAAGRGRWGVLSASAPTGHDVARRLVAPAEATGRLVGPASSGHHVAGRLVPASATSAEGRFTRRFVVAAMPTGHRFLGSSPTGHHVAGRLVPATATPAEGRLTGVIVGSTASAAEGGLAARLVSAAPTGRRRRRRVLGPATGDRRSGHRLGRAAGGGAGRRRSGGRRSGGGRCGRRRSSGAGTRLAPQRGPPGVAGAAAGLLAGAAGSAAWADVGLRLLGVPQVVEPAGLLLGHLLRLATAAAFATASAVVGSLRVARHLPTLPLLRFSVS
ncbi:hypothetical protein HDA40_007053 [Hamadaea flava]|uniref:Uncharacterized protein n=1 Tax=Hamadaea flava TaxID=1742688 RepID=A0ABV8M2R2_9ACTN|nr:hypothetical protein [Hamadaea flava]MCP2328546.1 hypothetical protein [Hamadaea flava]